MNRRIAVIILCQPAETAVTALTLRHLVGDLDESTTAHVLVNGGFAGDLQALTAPSAAISYLSSPINLGVAGGRNLLLRQPEVLAADAIVVLDNDVITPPGHVHRLVDALFADPQTGVVGPAILQLAAVAPALQLASDDLSKAVGNERLAGLGRHLGDEASWFHLGTHPDWRAVYLDELHLERRLVAGTGTAVEPFPAMNHNDSLIRGAIADGSTAAVPASNIAGCCQAFRRELLDDVGHLRDEFSPYGFEDVDFCLRVAAAGKRNVVDPAILMLHGTDQRHVERRSGAGVVATHRNFMRCKALLTWRHANAGWQATVERTILRRYLVARQAGSHRAAVEHLGAHVAGARDARRQIRHLVAGGEPETVR